MRSLIARGLTLAALGLAGPGCSGGTLEPEGALRTLAQLTVHPDSASVPLGDLIEYTAIVVDAEGDTVFNLALHGHVLWIVVDTTPDIIASVSPDETVNGTTARVRGTQEGWAWVVASMQVMVGTLSDTSKLQVTGLRP